MGITGTGDGGVLVEAPTCVPAKFGLLSVAEVEDRPSGHWEAGIEYELESCADLFIMTPRCNQTTPDLEKEVEDGTVDADNFGDPFTIISAYQCGAVGRPLSEAWNLAEKRLDRGQGRTVERAYWNGLDKGGNVIRQSLGSNDEVEDLTPVGGALSLTDAVAELEAWAADNYPCSPIIHTPGRLAVYLGAANVIAHNNTDVMRVTGTGSRVVVGRGYGTTGPLGDVPDAGEYWLYVTGALKVLRGTTFFTPDRGNDGGAVDRQVNNITVFAERTYAIEQDCIVGAVRVAIP